MDCSPNKRSSPLEDYDVDESKERLLHNPTPASDLEHRHAELRVSYKRLQGLLAFVSCVAAIATTLCTALGLNMSRTNVPGLPSSLCKLSIPRAAMMFELDDRFAGPSSPENDQAWNALVPQGDGFIYLTKSEAHELPPGKETAEGGFIYDISVFHQLHCLASIRSHLLLLQSSRGSNNSEEIQQYLLDPQIGHVYHCLDYIRQGLMCAGDMTLEWPREENDGRRFAFDGWGVSHQCKDWSAMLDFMQEHSVVNPVDT